MEFIALARQRPKPSPLGTPQGGLSCPFGAIHLQVARQSRDGRGRRSRKTSPAPFQGAPSPKGRALFAKLQFGLRRKKPGAEASVPGWDIRLDQKSHFSAMYAFSSLMGIRTCSMVSRSRTVTQLSAGVFSSPTVWKSTVMHRGVPISSSRR